MKKSKKKNMKFKNIIFIILVIILISGAFLYKYSYDKNKEYNKSENDVTENNKEKEETNNDKVITNEYEKASNYRKENLNRYEKYKANHQNMNYSDIVTYVNIGLDYDFYDHINEADLSKGILVLMNKYYKLPDNYEPNDLEEIDQKYFINGNTLVRKLRKEAKEAFEMLSEDSIKNNTPVYGQSGFRPYSMQEELYNRVVESSGKEYADTDTARPGHSEHQTGLAIDVASEKYGNMLSFDKTESFDWMKNNAHKYGFIFRYRQEFTDITGFMYESWHYRYVGVKVATDMHDNYPNMTYEEYYDRFIG